MMLIYTTHYIIFFVSNEFLRLYTKTTRLPATSLSLVNFEMER